MVNLANQNSSTITKCQTTLSRPGSTTTAATTAAAKMRATTSRNPSPSSLWAWASSSSPRRCPRLQAPQPPRVTQATGRCPCLSVWACASITTPAACISTTPTICAVSTRGKWTARGSCTRRLASWAAARSSWRSLSLPRGSPSEGEWPRSALLFAPF